ncbi:hypothetical protein [Fictibacillus fluitans]|uniref:Uncharacterized protein n=1 Tax=Fictibacillus fluitans TaxID=3058422 RepID=A0ABT8HZ31_9BACL|nr:hypothetical protein [Fictibacillus sp. NE201]MDN4526036.1 hypothetical protein [Fictibacillus sp. NE201]
MKKRPMLFSALLAGVTVISAWYWASTHQERMLNDYTNEKYGFDVEDIGNKGNHSNQYTVKRKDKPEDVFTIEASSQKFSSYIEYDNYAETEIIHEFNQQHKKSKENQRLEQLGFHHSHVTHYYGNGDEVNKRKIHDLKTALFLYQDKAMNESDASRFLEAIPIIESIKEKLTPTGNDLVRVAVFNSRYYPSLYKNDTENVPIKGAVKFSTKQLESVQTMEEARKAIENGSYN